MFQFLCLSQYGGDMGLLDIWGNINDLLVPIMDIFLSIISGCLGWAFIHSPHCSHVCFSLPSSGMTSAVNILSAVIIVSRVIISDEYRRIQMNTDEYRISFYLKAKFFFIILKYILNSSNQSSSKSSYVWSQDSKPSSKRQNNCLWCSPSIDCFCSTLLSSLFLSLIPMFPRTVFRLLTLIFPP